MAGNAVDVFCEMDIGTGCGWTVLQKRNTGLFVFNDKTMAEYGAGFGDASLEYWVGLDHWHELTNARTYQLQVDLEAFTGTVTSASANYDSIVIGKNIIFLLIFFTLMHCECCHLVSISNKHLHV